MIKKFLLIFVLPLFVGYGLALGWATFAKAGDRSEEEWRREIAGSIAVGWSAPACARAYPGTYELLVSEADIMYAIQSEAEDAAADLRRPNDHFFAEIESTLRELPKVWEGMSESKRRNLCANINKSHPGILKRHLTA